MLPFTSVLLVDDDPLAKALLHAYFESRGVGCLVGAATGKEGLAKLDEQNNEVELIVCDLNMPEMDGLQFLRHLMERQFGGHLLIVSGEDGDILRAALSLAESHDLQVIGHIKKPFRPEKLEALLAGYSGGNKKSAARREHTITADDLLDAMRSGDVKPFYQPKMALDEDRIVSAEALARWEHPEQGLISPGVFVPIAEEAGLVPELTTCILRQALVDLTQWERAGFTLNIAVNTDAETMQELTFPDEMMEIADSHAVARNRITLEVTERSLLADGSNSIEVIARLRMMGFRLSIDDFGTGTSNLKQLCSFPFNELKIDQSFLRGAESDRTKAICLNAIVALGKALELKVVAEGIETESDLAMIREAEVDEVQGYLIAKPMPQASFLDWLKQHAFMGDGRSSVKIAS